MHDSSFLRAVALHPLTQITHCKEASTPKAHCINYFLWMKLFFAMKEIVSSINIYALPKARFFAFRASNFKKVKKKGNKCISHGLYQWIIGNEISSPDRKSWIKLEIENCVFSKTSFKRNFVMHGISLSFTMFYQSTTECTHKIADISDLFFFLLQSVETQIYFI